MAYFSHRDFPDAFVLDAPRYGIYRGFAKRAIDIILTVALAPVALIIIGCAALFIARDGHSPFYTQRRIGLNGRAFSMLKLRSMVPNADDLLETYLDSNPEARIEWDDKQKLRNDPRITRFGKLIRKCSIDELPQLWNVLTGEMSIVGPRPMMVNQRDIYPGVAYYAMRPGITGYWQVSDRNESNFSERALHDTIYYREISLRADFLTILRTVGVVLIGTGQ
jgi:lipopolysaccharide/colanic/teichoic acid biosynthesis glycosyltransferase